MVIQLTDEQQKYIVGMAKAHGYDNPARYLMALVGFRTQREILNEIRLTDEQQKSFDEMAKERGYDTTADYVLALVKDCEHIDDLKEEDQSLIDKKMRAECVKDIEKKYLNLGIWELAAETQYKPIYEFQKLREFFEAWEDLLYYYKGHPDGVIDALTVFIYLEFTENLYKIANNQNLDKHIRERADGLKAKVKTLMDEILDEATNSADNFPEYI